MISIDIASRRRSIWGLCGIKQGISGMAKSGKPRPGVPRTSIALATLPFLMSVRAASLTV